MEKIRLGRSVVGIECATDVIFAFRVSPRFRHNIGNTAPTAAQRWMVIVMAECIKISKRVKYAGDVHTELLKAGWDLGTATLFLNNIPDAADVVEVVHCKDCEYWGRETIEKYTYDSSDENKDNLVDFAECMKWSCWSTCYMTRFNDFCSQSKRLGEDGFCSEGERRSE